MSTTKQPRQVSLFAADNELYENLERLVELLTEPNGREQRRRAVSGLRRSEALAHARLVAAAKRRQRGIGAAGPLAPARAGQDGEQLF